MTPLSPSSLFLPLSPSSPPLSLPLSPSSLFHPLSPPYLIQDNLDELLHHLIQLLSSADISNATCSAGVLSNLTCNNAKNKVR